MLSMSESEAIERYDEYLNDQELSDVIFVTTAYALKELDPTAYDCGFADWLDAENIEIE